MTGEALSLRLRAADPRLKIGLAVLVGLLIWRSGPPGLVLFGVGLGQAFLALLPLLEGGNRIFRAYGLFLVFWTGWKLLADLVGGAAFPAAAQAALLLGCRIGLSMLLGLVLALATDTRRMGRALAWAFRPVAREASWKVALAVTLLVHFLLLVWKTADGLGRSMRLRCPNLSFRERAHILPAALLCRLGAKTWDQTLALASRGLDHDGAWTGGFPTNRTDQACCLGLAALGIAAAWV